jgi:hypothetical protein
MIVLVSFCLTLRNKSLWALKKSGSSESTIMRTGFFPGSIFLLAVSAACNYAMDDVLEGKTCGVAGDLRAPPSDLNAARLGLIERPKIADLTDVRHFLSSHWDYSITGRSGRISRRKLFTRAQSWPQKFWI